MSWISRYHPPEATPWQGRTDIPEATCFFQIVELLDLTQPLPNKRYLSFGLLGFCCDEGIRRNYGRIGAAGGPQAIREVLAKLPIQKEITCYDAGNILCPDGDLEISQQALGEAVSILLENGITPIVLGGGHELAWGHYQGIEKKFPTNDLTIINFDAHFDMRPLLPNEQGTSGTPFLQIAKAHDKAQRRFNYNCVGIQQSGNTRQLFDTANDYHVQIMTADELHESDVKNRIAFIDRIMRDATHIYLSLCLDVFAAAFAPGVSAPQVLGVSPWHLLPLIKHIAASGKSVSYDVAELSPPYDQDNVTAKLAANFIHAIIHHHVPV